MKTKILVIASLLSAIAALFQLIPVIFSEAFLLLTVFSAIPIYIVSRINYKAGILSYFAASLIIMTLSVHESLFFLCTNGIVGLSLGIFSGFFNKRFIICLFSSLILTTSLSILNYGIGIPVLGMKIPGTIINQISILLLFSFVYSIFYLYISNYIFNSFKKTMLYNNI